MMQSKNKKNIIYVLSSLLVVTLLLIIINNHKTLAKDIEESIGIISDDIEKTIDKNPSVGLSSNPYDYIQCSDEYERLISKGVDILPTIIKIINDSPDNGLSEYILVIAAEDILKMDLRTINSRHINEDWRWATAKGWLKEFNQFISNLPEIYESILAEDSSIDKKNQEVEELGMMVIPLLLNTLEEGNMELLSVTENLLGEKMTITGIEENTDEIQNWILENKVIYSTLYEMNDMKILKLP